MKGGGGGTPAWVLINHMPPSTPGAPLDPHLPPTPKLAGSSSHGSQMKMAEGSEVREGRGGGGDEHLVHLNAPEQQQQLRGSFL